MVKGSLPRAAASSVRLLGREEPDEDCSEACELDVMTLPGGAEVLEEVEGGGRGLVAKGAGE